MIKRIPLGIANFDKLIEGGFVENSSIVLAGPPGSGKTIFALQFLYNGAVKSDVVGLYTSIEQNSEELKRQASRFGWDFDSLEKKKKISFLKIPIDVVGFDVIDAIIKEAKKTKAKRIIIDSLTMLSINASMYKLACRSKSSETTFGKIRQVKNLPLRNYIEQFIYIFISRISEIEATVLFIGESPISKFENNRYYTRDTVSEFVCDGVITFELMYAGVATYDRGMRIVKMRSTKHKITKSPIPMKIGEKGIELK